MGTAKKAAPAAAAKVDGPVTHLVLYKRDGEAGERFPVCSHEEGDETMADVHAAHRVRLTNQALASGGQMPRFEVVKEREGKPV